MKSVFLIGAFLCTGFVVMAQNKMTLKQAIELGIKNNIDVQQSDLLMQKAGITLNQSRQNMLPNLNASANEGINYGRSIDPLPMHLLIKKWAMQITEPTVMSCCSTVFLYI